MLGRVLRRFRAVAHAGLREDVADEELPGYLLVGLAGGDKPQHLDFPRSQAVGGRPVWLRAPRGARLYELSGPSCPACM